MPEVKPFGKASKARALQATLEESCREEALAILETDMLANSSRSSTEMKLKLYREFHEAWFGEGVPWLPVTPSAVVAIGAMLKHGNYSSGANYISAARVHSRDLGHAEHPLLAHTVRKVVISIERGVGQQKQTKSLPLQRLAELPSGDEPWVKGGPIGTADTLTAGSWWLMRELEVAAVNMSDVTIFDKLKQVELKLACSKNDSRAVGHGRTHGCCCDEGAAEVMYCPFHTVKRQWSRVTRLFPEALLEPEDFPFFPSKEGARITKQAFQQCVELAASFLGLPTRGARGEAYFTGHVCRRTGAEAFTAAGIEVSVTQIFGRWGSATVLRYCQEAPLAGSAGIAARLRKPNVSVASVEDSEADLLRATVSRLEALVEEQRNDLSALTYQTLQALRDEEKDDEVPQQPLAAGAVKVVNLDYDRHSPASRGMVGVVHIARVFDEEVPPQLWRARCGWKFGKKKCGTWRILSAEEDLTPYSVCDRCSGSCAS